MNGLVNDILFKAFTVQMFKYNKAAKGKNDARVELRKTQ